MKNGDKIYAICDGTSCFICDGDDLTDDMEVLEIFTDMDKAQKCCDEENEKMNGVWIDPAGGTHYGNDDDPAASYI